MLKLITGLILFMNLFTNLYALDCGLYIGQGQIKEKNYSLYFNANEKSKSELNLVPYIKLETRLAPFLNRPVSLKFTVKQKFEGTDGNISDIESIELRVPNPSMGANDNYVKLVSKIECAK